MAARSIALGIDVAAFVLSAPFVLGLCAILLRDYWAAGAVVVVTAYIAGSWALFGKTAGMALAAIELVDERTGRRPSLPQVVARTALTVPSLVGATVVLNEVVTPGPATIPHFWLGLAAAAALMGVISAAWGLFDGGRMLHDRVSGLITVRSEGVESLRRAVRR